MGVHRGEIWVENLGVLERFQAEPSLIDEEVNAACHTLLSIADEKRRGFYYKGFFQLK